MDALFGLNPYENDPGAWGASLINNAELLLACLEAVEARSVTEIGAYQGDLTRLLLRWAQERGARIAAIDPAPQPELEQLDAASQELTLIREPSLAALEHVALTDAIIVDGDHNYYTVSQELAAIATRAEQAGEPLPLLLLHDVSWPHGRRDDYYEPAQIPPGQRQPITPEGRVYPGVEGTEFGGLPYHWPAAREGGPRNGVLTAAEDFVAGRERLGLGVVPAFFGLGVIWPTDAPYAEALEQVLAPWSRHPLLERLERNRVLHLASSQVQLSLAQAAQERAGAMEAILERMLASRAFAAAELFLRVRQRGRPAFSRRQIRQSLGR
jgi:hypothetical protein